MMQLMNYTVRFTEAAELTLCQVYDNTDLGQQEVARGFAVCNPIDQPNKKLGRQLAFGWAMKAFHDKELRADMWAAYFRRVGVVRLAKPRGYVIFHGDSRDDDREYPVVWRG